MSLTAFFTFAAMTAETHGIHTDSWF